MKKAEAAVAAGMEESWINDRGRLLLDIATEETKEFIHASYFESKEEIFHCG